MVLTTKLAIGGVAAAAVTTGGIGIAEAVGNGTTIEIGEFEVLMKTIKDIREIKRLSMK